MASPLNIDVKNFRSRCVSSNKSPACASGQQNAVNDIRTNFTEKASLRGISTVAGPFTLLNSNFGSINIVFAGSNNIQITDALLSSLPEFSTLNIALTGATGVNLETVSGGLNIIQGLSTLSTVTLPDSPPGDVILNVFEIVSGVPAGVPPPVPAPAVNRYLVKIG